MDLDAHRGSRIKGERTRLGLSQQEAADAVGIRREMWAKYEAGAEPGAKALAGMALHGADVLYILTGQRSVSTPAAVDLSPRQRALLDNYEHTDEQGKKIIEAAAFAAAKPDDAVKPARGKKAA